MNKIDIEKWTHRAMPLYISLIIAGVPLNLLPVNWWSRLINAAYIVPVLALVVLGAMHGEKFCEYCAAATPADGDTAARKKRRTLRFYHQLTSLWGLAYLVAVIAVPMALPRVWPSLIASLVLMPGLLWMVWSIRVHDLLKPWCPWCHRGNGGDDLREPSPGPSHGVPLPVSQDQR